MKDDGHQAQWADFTCGSAGGTGLTPRTELKSTCPGTLGTAPQSRAGISEPETGGNTCHLQGEGDSCQTGPMAPAIPVGTDQGPGVKGETSVSCWAGGPRTFAWQAAAHKPHKRTMCERERGGSPRGRLFQLCGSWVLSQPPSPGRSPAGAPKLPLANPIPPHVHIVLVALSRSVEGRCSCISLPGRSPGRCHGALLVALSSTPLAAST